MNEKIDKFLDKVNIDVDEIKGEIQSVIDDEIDKVKPQNKQIGGSHYMYFNIQPYEFISKNNLSFFQGCVVKYVCRYMHKNGIEDLDKIIHYCELEKKKLKDTKKKKK